VGHRVNVGVDSGADAATITSALKQAGAESVRGPSAELPDVLVVDLKNETDADAFLRQAQKLPGVRYAERDSWQFSQ
jgi:cell division protein FtsX